ncbi:MAG: PqqD family protein [Thermodesulfobacteriota bacterium]|nr:PqqD family protein [Thermodesulfobacteriota bacterium]
MEDDVILAEVDGEGMIIDVEKGSSHFLNETALLIYKMSKEGKSEEEIKAVISREYDVDENEVEKDIRKFLELLEEKAVSWGKRNTSNRK